MKPHNRIYKALTIALGLMIMLVSCSEEVDFPLESTYVRLVVFGEMTTDTTVHSVKLSKSGDALNKYPGGTISNAIVTISDGSNLLTLHENHFKPGVYETDATVYGVPGRTYTLNISNVDVDGDGAMEEYTASSYLPKENPIDSITVQRTTEFQKGWMINLYSQEIGGGRNFYLIKAFKNDTLLTDSIYEYTNIADNTGFEGKYYDGFSVYTLSQDKLDERVKIGDKVTLEMDGITQDYENYILGFILEYYPKIPIFSGPSANVPTNIEPKNKAVGFFAAYSVARKSVIYNGE
jgi:hypothetical protein